MNPPVQFRFNPLKSAQAAAYILKRHGTSMSKYILLKMLYLADREALKRWNTPITGDEPHSMEYGPVPSRIYDLTKDGIRFADVWSPIIQTQSKTSVALKSDPGRDELSDEEIELIEEIYQSFKGYSFEKMKNFCHKLPEYDESVGKGSRPIKFETLLSFLGKKQSEIKRIAESEREVRMLKNAFGA
jgi:uncharacterized phage-associated protein